jgi:flagellar hook-associated protein 3 FlgL
MRITENMRFGSVQRSLSALRSREADVTNQISSGRRLNKPSDDPAAVAQLTRLSAQAARTADYQNTIGTVRTDISLSERTLAEASGLMVRAKEIALAGANAALSPSDRAALAVEVSALREQLVSTANTRGSRGFIFSGSQTSTAPLTGLGVYQGDAVEHEVEIAPGVMARVSVTGAEAFTADGGTDAFATLQALEDALRNDDGDGIRGTLEALETSRAQIVRVQAQAGLIMNRLDSADEALSVTALELAKRQSALADVDPFEAITELTQLTTTLEQAIAIARQTLNNRGDLF